MCLIEFARPGLSINRQQSKEHNFDCIECIFVVGGWGSFQIRLFVYRLSILNGIKVY